MLIWCLKHVKRFYPYVFSKWKFLFRKRIFESLYYDTFFFSFQKNYHGYKYVYFLQYHTLTFIHFMNGEGACWIIRKTPFNTYIF